MKFKTRLVAITVALAVFATATFAPVCAQNSGDHNAKQSWKKGMVRLTRTVHRGHRNSGKDGNDGRSCH